MATIYVRSTDGSDADDGSTWALAKATLAGAAAIDAAGDRIYVSDAHSESTANSTISLAFAGSRASPIWLICGDDVAEPPTAVAATGVMAATGNSKILIQGWAYVQGLIFEAGATDTGNAIQIQCGAGNALKQQFDNCKFRILSTTSNGSIIIGDGGQQSGAEIVWNNCSAKFSASGQRFQIIYGFLWRGGSLESGGTSPTSLFRLGNFGGTVPAVLIEGVDLSQLSTSANLFDIGSDWTGRGPVSTVMRNCKLPASWAGSLVTGTPAHSRWDWRVEMYNCDSVDTNYRLWIEDAAGSIKHETTLVKTGGASDGTTALSWKMVSGADAEYPHQTLRSPEIVRWNETTGSAITVTVDILRDSATNLTDGEVWLEVQYLGTSGVPLGSFVSDAKADVLATAADQTTSAASWTTTGMTNPNTQKLSVSFTPQEKGFIHAKVHLAKASTTVYVDPVLTVS